MISLVGSDKIFVKNSIDNGIPSVIDDPRIIEY